MRFRYVRREDGHRERCAYLYFGEDACLNAELVVPSKRFNLGVHVSDDGEDVVCVRLCVPPVSLFVGLESWRLSRVVNRLAGAPRSTWTRELSVRAHDWAAYWNLWVDPHYWTSTRPRWRDGSWHPFGFPGECVASEVVEEREVDVAFPSGTFRARATREQQRRRASWCPLFVVDHSSVTLDFEHLAVKPEDRKGRGIHSTTGPAATIEDAVAAFVLAEWDYNRVADVA